MVRVLAVWPGAVHRPRPELTAFVHLVAERAGEPNDIGVLTMIPGRALSAALALGFLE